MQKINKDHPAMILGMFETGLAVGRSLGRKGVHVSGLDFIKDIGFYSKYIKANLCPHPAEKEDEFVSLMVDIGKNSSAKYALFITSDDFLNTVSKNREMLNDYYLLNLPDHNLLESINDKYLQYKLSKKADIEVPTTRLLKYYEAAEKLKGELSYPVFLKAKDVNAWRKVFGGSVKGFVVNSDKELLDRCHEISREKIDIIAQEIIKGPETNHYKVNCYFSSQGEALLAFTLRKIRQNPVYFGFGSVVESVSYPKLMDTGIKLFKNIGYRGVGSAEFKKDINDGKFKLIEINPRYWQQNSLPEKCGMNFPLIDYMSVTGQDPEPLSDFEKGIKWINIYRDFDSFLQYRKNGELSFFQWVLSLKGKKVLSDFALDDIKPAFYEIGFSKKLAKLPKYIIKRMF
jgi:D-aspartate ligase